MRLSLWVWDEGFSFEARAAECAQPFPVSLETSREAELAEAPQVEIGFHIF